MRLACHGRQGLLGIALASVLCACAVADPTHPAPVSAPPGSPSPAASTAGLSSPTSQADESSASPGSCLAAASELDLDEQVDLLYMGAITVTTASQASAQLAAQQVGSVVLMADPGGARATGELTAALRAADPDLLVAADQEGGQVQRLAGPGFGAIPAASSQAALPTGTLRAQWGMWGGQLRDAGVRYDLGPVADLVPAANTAANAPIGQLGRGYGATRTDVVANASAVIGGLHDAGELSSIKHFPGLGNVTVNTDFGVAHDTVTTSDSPEVDVFADLAARTDSVMVGSVVYDRIDPQNPAIFSPDIITGILRQRLGFDKVIVSDDLGAAAALADYPVASRGTSFLRAGGDLALDVDPLSVAAMKADTVRTARSDPAFGAQLVTKAARVLALKHSAGLVGCQPAESRERTRADPIPQQPASAP
ncbi:beta-N-acetylhexosaminidase [Propionibacterium cyclohexanicum]|uniref:beta-N-acetylhexosaminidase n=1 Tax=Propionibacterium cyclohexanicum TaxID=64702 RepID=A0A1H9RV89_9ACTN|nr:glycoside hydrolase family 3 N-terminal domain-containing protein [Propionibacterium cyclohexanicum]SER76053.1 beta-N-acetylhexosaminidase [Propionibacterium cyclohexanicum]